MVPSRYTLLVVLAAALALFIASTTQAAPRLLSRHKGQTTLKLSGNTRLTLSRGCVQLPVGQGRPWKVRTGQEAQIVSDTKASLGLRNGALNIKSVGLQSQLRGATIENPMEVLRGLVHGTPKRTLMGLARRGVNKLADGKLSYTPSSFTLQRHAGGSGEVEVGLGGKLHVGSNTNREHRWSDTYTKDAASRWIRSTFQGSSSSRAQLVSILGQLAPAERTMVAGLVDAQLQGKAEASASLRAGQHRLPGGACTIKIADGAKATLRLELTGRTAGAKVRLTSASATVGLNKPVVVERPLAALHALKRGGRGTGLGRALRGAMDRMLNVSVDSLQLQRHGGKAATKVRLKGTLKLFNRFSLKLDRQVSMKDAQLGSSFKPADLSGLLSSSDSRVDLSLQPAGGASMLKLQTTPSLRFNQGAVTFTAPAKIQTPNIRGTYTIEGAHQF
jgi:hypothetical protein